MLATETTTMLLARTPIFAALPLAEVHRVAMAMSEQSFVAGQQVFGREDAGGELFLVLKGRVSLSIVSGGGQPLSFRHAVEGDLFGEIAVLDGGLRASDATALTSVRLGTLSRVAFMQLIATHPKLALSTIALLCDRLRRTSEQVEDLVLHPVGVRVAKLLLHIHKLGKTKQSGKRQPDPGALIDIGMSQGEMANLIGSSRQSVNIILGGWEKDGIVTKVGRRLKCDIVRLVEIAAQD